MCVEGGGGGGGGSGSVFSCHGVALSLAVEWQTLVRVSTHSVEGNYLKNPGFPGPFHRKSRTK